jgi:SsrA-binding protein
VARATPEAEGARDGIRIIAENRRARHDYFIEGRVEAGLVLTGTEIGSIRAGRVQLRDAFARIEHGEAFLIGMHVAPYPFGNRWNHEPLRTRKLLLHRAEIDELLRYARQAGRTLVPLSLYLRRGRAKVELGLARGKHQYDKRQAIAERDQARDVERAMAGRVRW